MRCRPGTRSKKGSTILKVGLDTTCSSGGGLEPYTYMRPYTPEHNIPLFVCVFTPPRVSLRLGCNCCEAEKMKITTKRSPLSPFSLPVLLLACLGETVGGVVFPVIMAACAPLSYLFIHPFIHPFLSSYFPLVHYTNHMRSLSLTHTHAQWESCEVMI